MCTSADQQGRRRCGYGWLDTLFRQRHRRRDRPAVAGGPRTGAHFRLCDEYHFSDWNRQNTELDKGCPNPFPVDCDRDLNDAYYCHGTAVGAGYCIMGNSSQEETFCGYCRAYLEAEFQQRFGSVVPEPTTIPVASPTPWPTRPPVTTTAGPTCRRHRHRPGRPAQRRCLVCRPTRPNRLPRQCPCPRRSRPHTA